MKRIMALLAALMILTAGWAAAEKDYSVIENAVAYMDCTFECGCRRGGLGTMVGKNALITAAHNLYCSDHAKPLRTAIFYFGYKGNGKCTYKYSGKVTFTVYDTFSNGYRSENDIGYVIFPSNIVNRTGCYGTMVTTDHDLEWEYSHVVGARNDKIIELFDQIDVHSDKQITFPITSEFYDAAAGGPVYWFWEDMDGPYMVAVYTSRTKTQGFARRLTNNIINDMKDSGAEFFD